MRNIPALLVALLLGLGGATAAAAQGSEVNEKTKSGRSQATGAEVSKDLLQLAVTAARLIDAEDEDINEVRRLLGNVRADARFEQQPPGFRAAVLGAAGYAEMRTATAAPAVALFRQSLAIDPDNPDVVYWLSLLEAELGDTDDSARTLAGLFRDWPELIDNLDEQHFWRLLRELDADSPARAQLLQAMFDSGWERRSFGGASRFWYELALIRANQGDTDALRGVVARVDGPLELVRLRSDKRFDAVVDPDDPAFDPLAAAERRVAALQAQAALAPGRLDIVSAMLTAMLVLGQHDDVLRVADEVQAAVAAAPADEPPYEDMDDLPWVLNQRSIALLRLGRTDEATRLLESASRINELGRPNISQALNLAQHYASVGRPDDALAAAARAGSEMSGFGRMVKASAEQRAALRKGDAAAAAAALDYLRTHRRDAEEIYLEALVEAGDLDAAAATLIAQLGSPQDRSDALLALQELREAPTLPGDIDVEARWVRLLARPDVQAAVAKVGRIQAYRIYRSE